jgi:hypothetical protein
MDEIRMLLSSKSRQLQNFSSVQPMILDYLIGITLERVVPDSTAITRSLSAAKSNMTEAHIPAVSAENRFDAPCKAIGESWRR